MKGRTVKWLCSVVFVAIIMLASGVTAQAQYQGQGADQGQIPDQGQGADRGPAPGQPQVPDRQQTPGKEDKSKPKEFRKVFCAERSVAQRFYSVNDIQCSEVCDNVYRDYPCEQQQLLDSGWKITSVAVSSIEVLRDPCECRLTGTESVLEREKKQ
jgi:hypothetical protein